MQLMNIYAILETNYGTFKSHVVTVADGGGWFGVEICALLFFQVKH